MYTAICRVVTLAALGVALAAAPAQADPFSFSSAPSPKTSFSKDLYSVAAAHYADGRWQAAADGFQQILVDHGQGEQSAPARFYLAEALVQLQRYRQALDQFQRFLHDNDQHTFARRARFRIGETSLLLGNRDQARQALSDFVARHPTDELNAFAFSYLGDLALAAGDQRDARRWYRQTIDRFPRGPTRPDAQLQLALLDYHAQQYSEAAAAFQLLVNQLPDGPLQTEVHYWLGMTQLAQGEFDLAAETLAATAGSDPLHKLAPASTYYSGEALRQAGELPEAGRHFDRVLQQWPDSKYADDSMCGIVLVALAARNYQRVEELAARFQRQYPDSPRRAEVRRGLARAMLESGRPADAVATLEDSLVSQASRGDRGFKPTDSAWDRYLLALGLLGQQRYADALRAVDQIAPVSPGSKLRDGVHVVRSSALFGLGQFDQAIEPLQAYLASQPTGPDAVKCRSELTVALAKLNRLDEAQEALDPLEPTVSHHPSVLWATQTLAETALSSGDGKLAGPLFAALIRDGNPAEFIADGLYGLGRCRLHAEQAGEADELFQRLLADFPDHARADDAEIGRGKALERLGQLEPALLVYQEFIERRPDSPRRAHALLQAARLHERLEQQPAALALLESLTRDHAGYRQFDAALYLQAWILTDLDRPDEAAAIFARLHAEHRDSRYWPDATYRLADRATKAKDYDRARTLLEDLIGSDPATDDQEVFGHALYLTGQVAALDHRWQDVSPPLERLLELLPDGENPLTVPAKYWIAEGWYQQRDYQQAERLLRELIDAARGRDEPWLAMVPLRLAQTLTARKNWGEAHELAVSIRQQYPHFAQQYEADYLIGRCLGAQGRFDEARAAYQRVVQAIGGESETAAMAQWMIGESYLHQRDYDAAIGAYLRADILDNYPRWRAGGLLQAGKCYEQQGRRDQAVQLYTRLLKHYPDTPFTEEASHRLRSAKRGEPSDPDTSSP